MTTEITLLVLITVLFIGTNAYWAYVCMRLTDRLMSRNFFEYTQGKNNLKLHKPNTHQLHQADVIDPETERQAKELNSLMGMI